MKEALLCTLEACGGLALCYIGRAAFHSLSVGHTMQLRHRGGNLLRRLSSRLLTFSPGLECRLFCDCRLTGGSPNATRADQGRLKSGLTNNLDLDASMPGSSKRLNMGVTG